MEHKFIYRNAPICKSVINNVTSDIILVRSFNKLATLFKMMSDNTRLRIMCALGQGEICVGELAELLEMSKASISYHLKELRFTSLVNSRRDGQHIYYSLADEHVVQILKMGIEHVNE